MSVKKMQTDSIAELYEMLNSLKPPDAPQNIIPTYLMFVSKKRGKLVEEAIHQVHAFLYHRPLKRDIVLIQVDLEPNQYGLGKEFFEDDNFRVYKVPKLMRWRGPQQLVMLECINWRLLQLIFEHDVDTDLNSVETNLKILAKNEADKKLSGCGGDAAVIPCFSYCEEIYENCIKEADNYYKCILSSSTCSSVSSIYESFSCQMLSSSSDRLLANSSICETYIKSESDCDDNDLYYDCNDFYYDEMDDEELLLYICACDSEILNCSPNHESVVYSCIDKTSLNSSRTSLHSLVNMLCSELDSEFDCSSNGDLLTQYSEYENNRLPFDSISEELISLTVNPTQFVDCSSSCESLLDDLFKNEENLQMIFAQKSEKELNYIYKSNADIALTPFPSTFELSEIYEDCESESEVDDFEV